MKIVARFAVVFVFIWMILLPGCGNDHEEEAVDTEMIVARDVSVAIGGDGGEIIGASRVLLSVPPGALSEPVDITLAVRENTVPDSGQVGVMVVVKPLGTVFLAPVELTIPVLDADETDTLFVLQSGVAWASASEWNAVESSYIAEDGVIVATISGTGYFIVGSTTHDDGTDDFDEYDTATGNGIALTPDTGSAIDFEIRDSETGMDSDAENLSATDVDTGTVLDSAAIFDPDTAVYVVDTETVAPPIVPVDSATEPVDTSTVTEDTGVETIDTTSVTVDTATEAVDTATETVDTVTETVDTATDTVDTETETVDTATETVDTETETVDTATETVDTQTETVHTETETVDTATETDTDTGTGTESESDSDTDFQVHAGGYWSSGPAHGYIWATAHPGGESTISPDDFSYMSDDETVCVSGTVVPMSDWTGVALLCLRLNQAMGDSTPIGTFVPSSEGVYVSISNPGNSDLRVQIMGPNGMDDANDRWCANVSPYGDGFISWNAFNTQCWDNTGSFYSNEPLADIAILVPGHDTAEVSYDFCIQDVVVDTVE